MPPRKRLTAADWTTAALDALAEGGLEALAVEPVATRLGATKGSFYWHFANRDALVEAALALWERTATEDVITHVSAVADPTERLCTLFRFAVAGPEGATAGAQVELALQPSAGHPLVAPVLERVTARRLAYLGSTFAELGFTPAEAQRRALIAYTAFLGHAQLLHATPGVAALRTDLPAYADALVRTLVSAP